MRWALPVGRCSPSSPAARRGLARPPLAASPFARPGAPTHAPPSILEPAATIGQRFYLALGCTMVHQACAFALRVVMIHRSSCAPHPKDMRSIFVVVQGHKRLNVALRPEARGVGMGVDDARGEDQVTVCRRPRWSGVPYRRSRRSACTHSPGGERSHWRRRFEHCVAGLHSSHGHRHRRWLRGG